VLVVSDGAGDAGAEAEQAAGPGCGERDEVAVVAITVDVIAAVLNRYRARKEVTRMTMKTLRGLVVPVVMSGISSLLVNLAATAACTGR
jgi:hypothetical protein